MQLLRVLISSDGFMPHGQCYLWNPGVVWLHVISDSLIALAYYSIPFTLVYFVRKRKDLAFHWMFLCFAVFIVACGTTHVMEIWNIWKPTYWFSGVIKALTALASLPTAILLIGLIPKALALPSPSLLREMNESLRREIIERTQTEARLRESEERFRTLVEELQQSQQALVERTAQLEDANHELEAFSYSVSHDLRAPLRSIDGFSLALREDCSSQLNATGLGYLQRIGEAIRRMGQLIDGLLELSRVTRAEMRQESVDLTALADAIVAELRHSHPAQTTEVSIQPNLTAHGDPLLLRVALENLLRNAFKFSRTKPRSVIKLGIGQSDGQSVFCIRDNGVGFDMTYAKQLFGPFQRLHPRTEFEGTGIGLATVQRIIRRHGGRIWADAVPNQGAAFYFTLPSAPVVQSPAPGQ